MLTRRSAAAAGYDSSRSQRPGRGSHVALGLGHIDAWDTGALEEFARQLARRSRALDGLGEGLADAAQIPGWTGLGADAARVEFDRVSRDLSDRSAAVGAVTELVASLIDQVRVLQTELDDARNEADRFGLVIADSGDVLEPSRRSLEKVGDDAAGAAREEVRVEIARRVRAILAMAADVEDDTTRILVAAAGGGFTGDGMSAEDAREKGQLDADEMFRAPPPPEDVAAQQYYLDALSPDQLGEILREHPDWLAGAYGIDPVVRERAAEAYLPTLRGEILTERAHVLQRLKAIDASPLAAPPELVGQLEATVASFNDQLADLAEIEAVTGDAEEVHLLGLRPYEGGVGAVVARGDIATADHVAVHVPGMGTETRDKPDAGNDLPGEMDKLVVVESAMAEHLTLDGRSHETIATVTYLNMGFPAGLSEAGEGHYADTAAPDLAATLNGINATSADGTNLTVLGHSYGSLTTSEALQAGGTVDRVVFYGSPGLESSGEPFDPVSTGVAPGNSYVMHAAREPIQGAHLLDPYGGVPYDAHGLTRLGTAASEDHGTGRSLGHSQYELPDSTSLWNLGAVASGTTDAVIGFDREKYDEDNYLTSPVGRVPLVKLW